MTHPRAFAVWFRDLNRWNPGSFVQSAWHWSQDYIKPLSYALAAKHVEAKKDLADIHMITLGFDGEIVARDGKGAESIKGKLYLANAGDVVFSKIDVRNGAISIIPESMPAVAVTSEFPVYRVRKELAIPLYIKLLFRTDFFRKTINGMISGASGRKRVQPSQLVSMEVPFPPISIQQAIVDRWQQAQAEIAAAKDQAAQQEKGIAQHIYTALGVPKPVENGPPPKCLALQWADLERWSFNYLIRSRQGLLGFHNAAYPIVSLSECLEDTTNGYCIKPVAGPTPHKMLKLNALAPSGLDLTKTKYITVPDNIARRFSLRKGDLLICRSVGSYDLVAKCALVEADFPDVLFPDIIIRARLKPVVLPQFVREVMQTPIGRSHFLSNARTAVGMWKIGAEDIRSFPLPLPPLDVQQEIVQQVAGTRAEIARIREAAERQVQESGAEIEVMILGTKKVSPI